MLKEDLFSANKAQTLPHAKVYNELINLNTISSSMGTPYSSYIQFLTIPWEEVT
jgi:hypothetical protein